MLIKEEKNFLKTIPLSKKAEIKPFHPGIKVIARKLIKRIGIIAPNLDVKFIGASALGISGIGDIDLFVLCPIRQFKKYISVLTAEFGKPRHIAKTFIEWKFLRKGHDVELYLTGPRSGLVPKQMKLFQILKRNPHLCREYQKLKESYDGKSFRAYQKVKYEFYNRVLK